MSKLNFDKEQLINLEYSLNREIIRSNRAGSYISTTLNGCNTRKYHGLLVCPIENFGGEKHVLLSSLDATIIQNKSEFNLGIHQYKGNVFEPKGHKYIQNIEFDHIPKITYRIGGVILTIERLLVEKKEQVLIRYTLEQANSPTVLRLKPFLAFRNIHSLSKANMFVNRRYEYVENGIKVKLYDGYPDLFMQLSHPAEFVPAPDWYYNIEYIKEKQRGYEYLEDLFVSGYFELPLEKGNSVVFAAGVEESKGISLKQRFTRELKKRGSRNTYINSMKRASEQFIYMKNGSTDIIAGYPWYSSITRQTFIALPGLCLILNNHSVCMAVVDTYLGHLKNGLFPDSIQDKEFSYHSADSSLWFIWTLQQYHKKMINAGQLWRWYGWAVKEILMAYRDGRTGITKMTPDGLIYSEKKGVALTWMNSYAGGKPVVERNGMAVEINALWYNALAFAIDVATAAGELTFADEWSSLKDKAGESFINTFWSPDREHLADVVKGRQGDWSVRPNMVIAAAMDYTPLSKEQQKMILSTAKHKLLTKRGLRTLPPDHLRYAGVVEGNQDERESAIHQGAVWPWLIQFFVEAYLKIHKQGGLPFLKQLIEDYESEMTEHSIGTISEIYDGNPPHKARGAISQAWNVAAVVYATNRVQTYNI